MAESGPVGAERAVTYTFKYLVSDQFIEDRMDLSGTELPKIWLIKFSLADLPGPGLRQRARSLWQLHEELGEQMPELDAPTDEPVEFLEQLEQWLGEEQERRAQEYHRRQQEDLKRDREVAKFEEEMNDWIVARGSDRLKTARGRRYKVTSSYARERGREELPEFWIDTAGSASYRERVDPTSDALRVETRIEEWLDDLDPQLRSRIVWLTEPPSGLTEALEAESDEFFDVELEQQEAILVAPYLGRYDALMPVDRLYRAPTSVDEPGEEA